jgi:hypothetical protein
VPPRATWNWRSRCWRVGLVGARSNLEMKLSSLTDEAFTEAVVHEIARLSDDGEAAANAAASSLRVLPA